MEKIINLRIPHIGEKIFGNLETQGLGQCLEVSQTWKILAKNVINRKGKMFDACSNGNTAVVKLLLKHYNSEESGLNAKAKYDFTPFMEACYHGHKDVVQLLLDYPNGNIDFNARTDYTHTAFMLACGNGHTEVVKILWKHPKIDVYLKCGFGNTGFMMACEEGHKDVVKFFFDQTDRNIDFNARNTWNMTAFYEACTKGHKDVVKLFFENSEKGKIDFEDLNVWTGYHWARKWENEDLAQFIVDYLRAIGELSDSE